MSERAAFEEVLAAAREPLEVAIDAVRRDEDAVAMVKALEPLLQEVGQARAVAKDRYVKRLRERTGLSVKVLLSEVSAASKGQKQARGGGRSGGWAGSSPPVPAAASVPQVPRADAGSCREVIERVMLEARAAGEPVPWERVGLVVYEWFEANGGKFFKSRGGLPYLFWENEVWPLRSYDPGERSKLVGMLLRLTGHVPTTTGPKTIYEVLSGMASDRGEIREQFAWIHTDVTKMVVYVNLNNARHELARVTAEGVEVVPNGLNEDHVILKGDPKFAAVELVPSGQGADSKDLDALVDAAVGTHMACTEVDRRALLDWLACFPLLEFAGTRPMVRLEGHPGSGKTWAAKMLTTMVYGSDAQKKSTDAANYADASRNPLVALDNVETHNTTPSLLDFLLTSVTGITREKRAAGTDSATIQEKPLCLVASTGVEPLAGELEEVLSRSIIVHFEVEKQEGQVLLEKHVLARIKADRDKILSAILRRTSDVLRLMMRDGHGRAMRALRRALGSHGKRRCDEYLALMYLQRVAAADRAVQDQLLDNLDPVFALTVRTMDDTTAVTAREASPVATALTALFVSMRGMSDAEVGNTGLYVDSTRSEILGAAASHLFGALKKTGRDRGLNIPWSNPIHFSRRLESSREILTQVGFDVRWTRHPDQGRAYWIRYLEPSGGQLTADDEKAFRGTNGHGTNGHAGTHANGTYPPAPVPASAVARVQANLPLMGTERRDPPPARVPVDDLAGMNFGLPARSDPRGDDPA